MPKKRIFAWVSFGGRRVCLVECIWPLTSSSFSSDSPSSTASFFFFLPFSLSVLYLLAAFLDHACRFKSANTRRHRNQSLMFCWWGWRGYRACNYPTRAWATPFHRHHHLNLLLRLPPSTVNLLSLLLSSAPLEPRYVSKVFLPRPAESVA